VRVPQAVTTPGAAVLAAVLTAVTVAAAIAAAAAALLALSGCAAEPQGAHSTVSPSPYFDPTRGDHHWVVWVDSARYAHLDDQSTVRAVELESGEAITVSKVKSTKLWPKVSYRWIVWLDGRSDPTPLAGDAEMDLYCYDVATGEERRLTRGADIEEAPALCGGLVAWAMPPEASKSAEGAYEGSVMLLNLDSGERAEYQVPGAFARSPVLSSYWPLSMAWWSFSVDPASSPELSTTYSADIAVVDLESDRTLEDRHWLQTGTMRTVATNIGEAEQQQLTLCLDSPRFIWQQVDREYGDSTSTEDQIMLGRVDSPGTRAVASHTSTNGRRLIFPVIARQKVVWYEPPSTDGYKYGAICVRDLHTGVLHRLCEARVGLGGIAVSSGLQGRDQWIAWDEVVQQSDAAIECDIIAYDLTTHRRKVICDAPGDQSDPQITGDWVVWLDARNSPQGKERSYDIYARNLETGEERAVCTDPTNQGWLSVSTE